MSNLTSSLDESPRSFKLFLYDDDAPPVTAATSAKSQRGVYIRTISAAESDSGHSTPETKTPSVSCDKLQSLNNLDETSSMLLLTPKGLLPPTKDKSFKNVGTCNFKSKEDESLSKANESVGEPNTDDNLDTYNESLQLADPKKPNLDSSNDDLRSLSRSDKIKNLLQRGNPSAQHNNLDTSYNDDLHILSQRDKIKKSLQCDRQPTRVFVGNDGDLLSEDDGLLKKDSIGIDDDISYEGEEEEVNILKEGEKYRNQSEKKIRLKPSSGRSTVTFNTISIREYVRIVGDNPACSSGVPIAIGWSYEPTRDLSVDLYERYRDGRRRDVSSMKMPKDIREDMLKNEWGVSLKDIMTARSETLKVQKQRKETKDRERRRTKWKKKIGLTWLDSICCKKGGFELVNIDNSIH